jgi:hypothetical protein
MRPVIGLVALTLIGGVAPTGLSGNLYAAPVLAGTAVALVLLVAGCMAGASLARHRARPVASVASRIPLGREGGSDRGSCETKPAIGSGHDGSTNKPRERETNQRVRRSGTRTGHAVSGDRDAPHQRSSWPLTTRA